MCSAMFSIGLLVAGLAPSAKAAAAIGMLLFFPSMFFAGIWTPGDLMPEAIRPLREITPMGAGMTALQDTWAGAMPSPVNLVALAVVTVVVIAATSKVFRWE